MCSCVDLPSQVDGTRHLSIAECSWDTAPFPHAVFFLPWWALEAYAGVALAWLDRVSHPGSLVVLLCLEQMNFIFELSA